MHRLDVGVARYKTGWVLLWEATRCPNLECNELALSVGVKLATVNSGGGFVLRHDLIPMMRLRPNSFSKPQPDYIPQVLRDDYYEACKIRDLSPKAAATLARRCLQGIIRDFWKVNKRTLRDEVTELKTKIDSHLWEAIDGVREVGNIGAHMERDVNVIIDIEPDEAQRLIALIEVLFEETYVARHQRQQRVAEVTVLANEKNAEKKSKGTPPKAKSSGTSTS